MSALKITGCRNVNPVEKGNQVGYVDIEFNNALVVKGFKVFRTKDDPNKFFARPPQRKKGDKWNDMAYFTKESGLGSEMYEEIVQWFTNNVSSSPV
jgi:DNA-binding cell septation regulator SpoVG